MNLTQAEHIRQRQMELARRKLEDMAAVCALPQGQRILAELLADMKVGQRLICSEADIALYNLGIELAGRIAGASPKVCLDILGELFGVYKEKGK